MQVHYHSASLPVFNNAVITIGTFDGVHSGHCSILQNVVAKAKEVNGESVLVTFHPHPRMVLANQNAVIKLINTLEERIDLVAAVGIDHLVIVPFTAAFAEQSAIEYVEDFLVSKFKPNTIVIGYDHRFGKGRTGNLALLELLKDQFGYKLIEIKETVIAENAISSTRIRKAILNGQLNEANTLLGYTYFFSGLVVEGNKLGRTIGYPTANLQVANPMKLLPHNGVYAVMVKTNASDAKYGGMMNIGVRPTVNGTLQTVEVHLFDFDANLYGDTLTVFVSDKLRDEQKFSGLDALKEQLRQDEIRSRKVLAKVADAQKN